MPLLKKTQRSFSGGQIDKDLTGRQDLAKYAQGCLALENFKVRKQGNVVKRAGTDLAADLSALVTGTLAKLVPLVQERERGLYVLLAGRRAYLLSRDGVRLADGTWSRSPTAETALAEPVPFDDADLPMLDHCQSGDTLFFAHRAYPPGKLVYADGKLAYARILFRQGQGTPPRIKSVTKLGDKWTGTGGTVHLEYAVTAVKDGVETGMSVPFATEYSAPWDTSGSIRIDIDTDGLAPGSWDCFYVYKKEADVFGLIGTTSRQTAFVDVSDGFSVSGDLYPPGFTEFDRPVHLRESGNRFASAHVIYPTLSSNAAPLLPATYYQSTSEYLESVGYGASYFKKVQSATSQKSAQTTVTYAFGGIGMSRFTVRIGSLVHYVENNTEEEYVKHNTWNGEAAVLSYRNTSWRGLYSDFTPSPASHYRARLTFSDGSISDWIDCELPVAQSCPGEEWDPVSGSSPVRYRRRYRTRSMTPKESVLEMSKGEFIVMADNPDGIDWGDEPVWPPSPGAPNFYVTTFSDPFNLISYESSDAVLSRMDAYGPNEVSSVDFTVPEAHAAKSVTKIEVAGFADEAHKTPAAMVVNGLACYQSGRFVGSFTDDYITPDLTITPPKAEDHFLNPGEYPGCVALYSQRLVYAASTKSPFTFWMSCTGDLYNFDRHEYVRASDAITASTSALSMPRINRMLVNRDLMLFADGGEWLVAPSAGNAVAASTIAAKLQSVIGCAPNLKPVAFDSDVLFVDGSGEAMLATRYNFASDGYESQNLTVLSQRLFRNNPIRAFAHAQFPESTVECVLADGSVASLVYMKEHDVCAWSLHRFGGGWKAQDVAANKALVRGTSDVLFLCRREVSSTEGEGEEAVTSRRTEWAALALRDIDPDDRSLAANLRMDAVRLVEGETAPAAADGETVVRVGAAKWAVGHPFASVIRTTSPEFTEQETAQMEVKNATEAEIRVIDGSDFTVRAAAVPEGRATEMKVPCPVDEEAFTVSPGDADCRLPLTGANSRDGSVVLRHDGHLPLTVLSVTTSYRIEYANHGWRREDAT